MSCEPGDHKLSRRPTSTKTRIETFCASLVILCTGSRRPTSTKTRIETFLPLAVTKTVCRVEDQHPLKQGLKLKVLPVTVLIKAGRRPTSTKTRIETVKSHLHCRSMAQCRRPTSTKTRIETLKFIHPSQSQSQSRRPTSTKTRIETIYASPTASLCICVEDQHPLKQGLKHLDCFDRSSKCSSRRPTSTKTRIETQIYGMKYSN